MLKPAVRRGLKALAAFALVAVVALGLAMAWLASAPIEAGPLEPVVERVLAAQVEGGKATVQRVQVVRYPQDDAIGLRLHGVNLVDAKGRPVLRAKVVEAALGSDSIVLFAAAPSRLVLKDFFVAASVSPQGRFALGYEAKGPPPSIDLATIALSLTGEARRDRPLSYLRRAELTNGVLVFREVGGPVAWRANIQNVAFEKASGRLNAVSRLTINDGQGIATVFGQANGDVGLGMLTTGGSIRALTPSRIFPAVGVTRPLSILDAPVEGRARLQYALDRGVTAADVSGRAGEGNLRVGGFVQPFHGAEVSTRYDPASKQVLLERFDFRAEKTHLDVTGRAWLVPEQQGRPARLEYRLQSAASTLTLAPSSPTQSLQNLAIAGAVTPRKGLFEVADLSVLLAGAPVRASLAIDHADVRRSPGVKALITTGGPLDIQSLYAFWPESIAPAARMFVTEKLTAAKVLASTVRADIPPGQIGRRVLTNEMLRVDFRYSGGALKAHPQLPGIEDALGAGTIQGNRFDLTMQTGRIGKLAISDAVVTVPRFLPKGAVATVRSRVQGDLGDMLRLVDAPPLGMMKASSMSPDRFSGPADLVLEMKAPLRADATRKDVKVSYQGRLNGLRIKDVTLGEDLKNGRMQTRGNLDFVEASGPGQVGPFGGQIAFRMPLKGADAGRKHITLDGKAALFGADGAPFKAKINTRNGIGGADVVSSAFEGRAEWRKGERSSVVGVSQAAGWRAAGFPVGPGMPARIPVRIAMTYDGARWNGDFEADAYSGHLTYAKAPSRTVRYTSEITPAEAKRIGVGDLPMFRQAQSVTLEAHLGEKGSAAYRVGPLDGKAEWTSRETGFDYRFATALDRQDLTALGIPLTPPAPLAVNATGHAAKGALSGEATLAGANLRYAVAPKREGRRDITLSGSAGEAMFQRLGLDVSALMTGRVDWNGRFQQGGGKVTGRLAADLDRAGLSVPNSGWSKPMGGDGSASLDLALADGTITLQRIAADAEGLQVRGSGALRRGTASIDLPTARLEGFFEGSVHAKADAASLSADVVGRYLDFRPILKAAQKVAGGGKGGAVVKSQPARLKAKIDRVRVTDSGYVNGVDLAGTWGDIQNRRAKLTATSEGGGGVDIRAYPDKGATALSLQVDDLGDIARTLGGYANLKGGKTTGTGRIVPDGYDFNFTIRDFTMMRVPGAAQLLAHNGSIHFDEMVAPLSIRGSEVTLGDVRASGASVGLTARGIMDTKTRTMDVVGVVTPANSVNGPAGQALGAREGEGLFGVTYHARGPFTAPEISINPLSALLPGFLRRMLEPKTPQHPN